jgi:hypothetical protein
VTDIIWISSGALLSRKWNKNVTQKLPDHTANCSKITADETRTRNLCQIPALKATGKQRLAIRPRSLLFQFLVIKMIQTQLILEYCSCHTNINFNFSSFSVSSLPPSLEASPSNYLTVSLSPCFPPCSLSRSTVITAPPPLEP